MTTTRQLSPSGIPFVDWGGEGPVLHLAHANGFPPGTYNDFVRRLTGPFHVIGMECRALWGTGGPVKLRHWRELAADLARFLQEMDLSHVVAAGHSLGGVTSLWCAAAHPELVRALILIDPVIVPAWFAPLWALAMHLGLNRQIPLARHARQRRMEWPRREVLLRAFRSARVFARWQGQFLRDYVDSVVTDTPSGGVRLRYPREWEARIFETPPPDVWCVLPKLRHMPMLVLRGEHSDTYRRDTVRLMRGLLPQARFVEIAGADHFVPMSKPQETAQEILAFLQSL